MLSVINRGTITGSDTDGLPYKVVSGYEYQSFQGKPLNLIKLIGTPEPIEIDIDPILLNGYMGVIQNIKLENVNIVNIPINPVIKNGYTPITINPEEG